MRLINIRNLEAMKLEEFHDRQIPPYAILSHTWGEREATYQDFCSWISDSAADGLYPEPTHPGLEKIKSFAVWAHNSGHEHIWVDTCCIDKSSSAELSEAINSMYKWYRNSQICCVYLVDVPPYGTNHDLELLVGWERKFRESRWLTRGWTLQEILAPKAVKFVANDWETTLDEEYIYGLITEQTAIPRRALEEFKPARWSIAQRMSWAASRETTREEDRAYCLLGLFGVHMPLLYGEGSRAFLRLQEEILKTATDQSIFCWTSTNIKSAFTWRGLLARSPAEFGCSGNIVQAQKANLTPTIQNTNRGIQMKIDLRLCKDSVKSEFIIVWDVERIGPHGRYNVPAIRVQRISEDDYVRVGPESLSHYHDSVYLHGDVPRYRPGTRTINMRAELEGMIYHRIKTNRRIAGFVIPTEREAAPLGPRILLGPKSRDSSNGSFHWATSRYVFAELIVNGEPHLMDLEVLLNRNRCHVDIFVRLSPLHDALASHNKQFPGIHRYKEIWLPSQCCEWMISPSACQAFNLRLVTWIELDDDDIPFIHMDIVDDGKHYNCHKSDQPAAHINQV